LRTSTLGFKLAADNDTVEKRNVVV
jgi:hypothetical protein